jgi:nucleoid-associated protein YgaU
MPSQDQSEFEEKKEEEKRKSMDFTPKTDFRRPAKSMATHTVSDDDTLSDIALKYYGHATKPYYMHIYEANKTTIGDNPNVIRPGIELQIPELPEELK